MQDNQQATINTSAPKKIDNFLNSLEWQKFQEEYGFPSFYQNNNLFIAKKALFFTYYLASRVTFTDNDSIESAIKLLPKPVFIKIEPEDNHSLLIIQKYCQNNKLNLFKQPPYQPTQTLLINLEKELPQILSEMKQKHRYNLKIAQKNKLKFELFSNNLDNYFERFWLLHSNTAKRQQFHTHPKPYYQKMIEILEKEKMIHLGFITNAEGTDLATTLLITYKNTATYLHGGSHQSYKHLMAPYLLHFESIKFAKEKGLKIYDFWGVSCQPINDPSNLQSKNWTYFKNRPSAGTTRFKLGFGGEVLNYPGTYNLVIDKFKYKAYNQIRNLKRKREAFI